MRLRAIIFEDDDALRELLSNILHEKNYEVISASSPMGCPVYEDLTALCPHKFACGDFLITDNHMPAMTGLEFVLAQEQRGCKGVVHNKAVMSACWADNELKLANYLGCKVFKKPFSLAEINKWLDEREKLIPHDRKLDDLDFLDSTCRMGSE
jgi:CheY-like chemotaxis protein